MKTKHFKHHFILSIIATLALLALIVIIAGIFCGVVVSIIKFGLNAIYVILTILFIAYLWHFVYNYIKGVKF